MPAAKPNPDTSAAVDAFMSALTHAYKPAIERLRELILAADPAIAEGVKWNAPSFRTQGYFATIHLHAKQGIALILHLGAKGRADAAPVIDDPAGLLRWLAKDRAMLSFGDEAALLLQQAALTALIRQWIRHNN